LTRGQAYSIDFIFSAVMFSLVLLVLLPLWSTLDVQLRDAESRKEMQISTVAIADLLTRSTGSPANWSNSTVFSIGLANRAHELNTTKFLRLKDVTYVDAKSLLGIAAYNISINITQSNGYLATSGVAHSPVAYYSASTHEMQQLIDDSGLDWDYYWGHDMPGTEPDHGDSKNFFDGSEAAMMNAMLFNATANNAYRTIIIEQPGLARAAANTSAMTQFVEDGGRLIFEGQGNGGEILIEELGATPYNGLDEVGLVNTSDWFFSAPLGLAVNFQSSAWSFYQGENDESITIEVTDSSNLSRGLVANWNFGNGRVDYITDINGTVGGDPLTEHFAIGGERLEYGILPTNESDDIFVASRPAVLLTDGDEGRRLVSMELLVWR